jgi:REP element-mobilizing transposase RayT
VPSKKIDKDLNNAMYFILSNSLRYCKNNKNLDIVAFVFMLNHIHLIVSSKDVTGFVRDFKRFTSKEIKNNINRTEQHVLKLFINKKGEYHLWQKTNMPLYIESDHFFQQKLEYIHNNPVVKNYVAEPEYWYWSSANEKCELKANRDVW